MRPGPKIPALVAVWILFLLLAAISLDGGAALAREASGSLYISLQSQEGKLNPPGEMVISDPDARVAGFDPRYNLTYQEIAGATYKREFLSGQPEQEAVVLDLRQAVSGTYSLRVIGVDSGVYYMAMQGYDAGGNRADVTFSNARLQPGEVHHYVIDYSNQAGASLKVRRTRVAE